LGRFTGTAPTETEWQWATETIRKAAEHARQIGVRIAIEPLNRFEMYMVNTVSDGARFVKQVGMDNVGLLVDTHHGNIEELNVAEAWKEISQHIFHIHISENHRGIPGSGHAIPDSIFTAIKEMGYDDWVTIEAFNQAVPGLIPRLHLWRSFAPQDSDIATKGLQFIKSHLQ
jgi:D-psicose/D-tagatose/L-ribulose 3-epimerase